MSAGWATVMGRQSVDFSDTREGRNQRRPNRPSGPYQVSVRKRLGNKFMRNEIQYCVSIADDGVQLLRYAFLHHFRKHIPIKSVGFLHGHFSDFFIRTINFWWEGSF